ncbi:MAG: hypothetical protein JNK84_15280 [Phreatobacter sp.]|uniref:hypothetical protein n=1 Tax=Phreatobacter sp. TaxID=1966341 RepID=UPI001A4932CB|nr:hypothetical protein [Phreatobacter sp.]MBL8570431.1 hypothetical protein [Phreatobacter sp.]
MHRAPPMPDRLRDAIAREFAGDPPRWTGQSSSRAAFLRSLPIWLFAIPWTAFSLFWEVIALGGLFGFGGTRGGAGSWMAGLFVLFGLPFVVVGIGMMGAPFWMARRTRRSAWVVTARRVASVMLTRQGVTVRTILARNLLAIERTENADGSGSLKLQFGEARDSDGDKVERSETIEGVQDVRRVEQLIRAVMAAPPD